MVGLRLLLQVASALCVASQGALSQATLRGVVRIKAGNPLEAAEVQLRPSGLQAKTAADGRFTIAKIPAGDYLVFVRAVGYQPVQADAEFRGTDTLTVTFELEHSVQVLESLHVEAPATHVGSKLATVGFDDRRKASLGGRFLTREDLVKREHSPLSNVLRMVSGMNLVRRRSECGDGFAPANSRGVARRWLPWMTCNGGFAMPPVCYMTIYLDGVRIWAWGQSEIPDIDQVIAVNEVEGIEVYNGPAELPMQFQATGSACGAVLLWSRN